MCAVGPMAHQRLAPDWSYIDAVWFTYVTMSGVSCSDLIRLARLASRLRCCTAKARAGTDDALAGLSNDRLFTSGESNPSPSWNSDNAVPLPAVLVLHVGLLHCVVRCYTGLMLGSRLLYRTFTHVDSVRTGARPCFSSSYSLQSSFRVRRR